MLAVKNHQPTLRLDLERLFTEGSNPRRRSRDELPRPTLTNIREADDGHGRIDEWTVYVCNELDWLTTREQWTGLGAAVMVEAMAMIVGARPSCLGPRSRGEQRSVDLLVERHVVLDAEALEGGLGAGAQAP